MKFEVYTHLYTMKDFIYNPLIYNPLVYNEYHELKSKRTISVVYAFKFSPVRRLVTALCFTWRSAMFTSWLLSAAMLVVSSNANGACAFKFVVEICNLFYVWFTTWAFFIASFLNFEMKALLSLLLVHWFVFQSRYLIIINLSINKKSISINKSINNTNSNHFKDKFFDTCQSKKILKKYIKKLISKIANNNQWSIDTWVIPMKTRDTY